MDETGRVELERVERFRDRVRHIPEVVGGMTFGEWLSFMTELQEIAYGAHYQDFDPETRADSIRMNFMACVKELSEMTDEMGWKPWSSPQGWINREAAIDEAVDAMHFLANLLSHTQCTGPELTRAYKRKMLKNLDRQIAGYDVRVEKCGYCQRDLSGMDQHKLKAVQDGDRVIKVCSAEHARLYNEEKRINR